MQVQMAKLPKLPKGWILKSKRDGYAFWGDKKNNKDFTIIAILKIAEADGQ